MSSGGPNSVDGSCTYANVATVTVNETQVYSPNNQFPPSASGSGVRIGHGCPDARSG
jgi:hypothetical protein